MNRKIAPELSPIESVKLRSPKKISLGNGINLFWMKDIPDNTVKLDFVWDAGSKYQSKPLVASFCNQLLMSGNDTVTAQSISEEIDSHGGYLSHSQHKDHAGITIFGLTESIDAIFKVVQAHLTEGYFSEIEISKLVDIRKKEFELNEEKVGVNARKLFTQKLFGSEHYYGKLADIDDFDNVKQNDLRQFFNDRYIKSIPSLFLVGNVSESFIDDLKAFVTKFSKSESTFNLKSPEQSVGSIYKSKQGSVQSAIRIGKLSIDKSDPDFVNLQVLNTILGGYFGSRLMANIREDKGYTYGIGSGITALQDASYFYISTEVAVEKRADTLKEIYYEIERLQNELVSEQELAVVKNYMLGSFLRNSDGAIAMMEKYKNIQLQNLNNSYYDNYIRGVNKATPKELNSVAKKYFNHKDFVEISFG